MNMDDARAILLADQLDEEEEQTRMEEAKREADKDDPETTLAEKPFTAVHTNFDPAQLPATATSPRVATPNPEPSVPKAAKRSDVVFEATAAQVQELVLESPVPVLLDVYADWCGPCKVLGPALEEMAIKAGGAFRLVKINSDREQVISTTLEVTALPTVFGIRDGQIVHMFQGLPRSNEFIQNFMMNLLMPGYSSFDPPITSQEKKKYADTTTRLAKMAGAACWPFAARERMQDRVLSRLDALVKESGGMAQADDSAKLLRSLLSNVIRDPYNLKFRNVNLANKALAKKVSCFPSSVAILRTVGFADDGGTNSNRLALKPQQKVINVAPLVVARDCIDKWIDKNRYEIAVAARKRKDDMDRAQLAEEAAAKATAAAAAGVSIEDDEDEIEESALLPNSCTIKIRLEGKKKIHEVVLDGDKPLRTVLDALPSSAGVACDAEFQLTCAAKRLIIKSSDKDSMDKSLADHGLLPMASFVVKTLEPTSDKSSTKAPTKSKLSARAAVQKSRKKGSHTMQSIGVYAKDDNNKAELIDGGGGVWYEHDVSDDEGEGAEPAKGGSSPRDQQKDIDQSEPDEEVDEESEPDDVDGEHDNDEPEETS
jgi:thioredoxin